MFEKWFAKKLARAEEDAAIRAKMKRISNQIASCDVTVVADSNATSEVIHLEVEGWAHFSDWGDSWASVSAETRMHGAISNLKREVAERGFTFGTVHYMPHRISHLQIGEIKITEKENT